MSAPEREPLRCPDCGADPVKLDFNTTVTVAFSRGEIVEAHLNPPFDEVPATLFCLQCGDERSVDGLDNRGRGIVEVLAAKAQSTLTEIVNGITVFERRVPQ